MMSNVWLLEGDPPLKEVYCTCGLRWLSIFLRDSAQRSYFSSSPLRESLCARLRDIQAMCFRLKIPVVRRPN